MSDQWSRWHAMLRGESVDLGARGDFPSGYFRLRPWKGADAQDQEIVAVWRDEGDDCDGALCAWRSKGNLRAAEDGSITALTLDEIFEGNDFAAIPATLYEAVVEHKEPWPEIYTTWLPTKDITAGVVWSEAWARKFLAQNPETHDEGGNPRAVAGDNNPPEDLTPDKALAKRVANLGLLVKSWLDKIGGRVKTAAEAETLATYANKYKDFSNEATAAHKVAKDPYLVKCREIDSLWFAPVRDKAEAGRARVLDLIREFTSAEDARKREEAVKAAEARREAAQTHSQRHDEPPPIVEAPKAPEPTKVAGLRGGGGAGRAVFKVVDLAKVAAYLAAMEPPPADFVAACEKLADKIGRAGIVIPGVEKK